MPGLSKYERQAIEDLRRAGYSKKATAEMTGVSDATVRKYDPEDVEGYDSDLEKSPENAVLAISDDLDPREVLADDYIPDDWTPDDQADYTGPVPGKSPLKDDATKDLRLRDDYSSTNPGQFIKMFFDDFDVGVRSNMVEIVSRRAKRRGKIPDEDKMKSLLLTLPSGISNTEEARFIAEEYWAEAQEYLAESDVSTFGTDDSGGQAGQHGGQYVAPGQGGDQEGEWVQIPGRGMVYGRFETGPNGTRQFVEMPPPQPQQPGMAPQQPGAAVYGPPGQQQQDDRVDRLEERVESGFEQIAKQMDSDPTETLKQAFEFKREMDEMFDDESSETRDRIMQSINEQIAQLREEMKGQAGPQPNEDPKMGLFRRALQDESVDHETLMTLADRVESGSDPEVRKKEIEMEMEREKMKRRKQTTEKVMDSLENVFERFGAGLGSAITGDESETRTERDTTPADPPQQRSAATDGHDSQQAAAAAAADAPAAGGDDRVDEWECPHCGSLTEIDTATPGVSCDNCDFTRVPCPECNAPLDVPPASEAERSGCPECNEPIPIPEDMEGHAACISCEWHGDVEEALGDTVTCDQCGSRHPISTEPSNAA